MANGADDYLSFVRGFIAASNHDVHTGGGPDSNPPADVDADAYAQGLAAGSQPVRFVANYRDLCAQDEGRVSGMLEVPAAPTPPAPPRPPRPPAAGDLGMPWARVRRPRAFEDTTGRYG
jgi:hypothetical protein